MSAAEVQMRCLMAAVPSTLTPEDVQRRRATRRATKRQERARLAGRLIHTGPGWFGYQNFLRAKKFYGIGGKS